MNYFTMTKEAYGEYVKAKSPNSKLFTNMLKAFIVGGFICCVGQAFMELFKHFGVPQETSATITSMSLIFIGALLTGFGWYDDIANFGGAGTLVPITGFANAMVSPALEFKTEGFVTGTGAKMFVIAGPVIVYGITASIIFGIILWLWRIVNYSLLMTGFW